MALYNNGMVEVYPNQVPYDTDVLRSNLYNLTGVSALAATTIGCGINYGTVVRGFPCVPVSPPGLSVVVGSNQTPDIIYSLQFLNATNYGSIPADTAPAHQQFKQGFNWGQVTLSTPAPVTTGYSVIHLVQVAFSTQDVNNVSRPYYNSANPPTPIFNNNFDTRTDLAVIQLKQGVAAASPTPPTPDPGFIGLWYVRVSFGQTSIVSGNISKVSSVEGSPFITESLTEKVSAATVAASYLTQTQFQQAAFIGAIDAGTTNNIVINFSSYPIPAGGIGPWVLIRVLNANTGAVTITINGNPYPTRKEVYGGGRIPLQGGELNALGNYLFCWDSSAFQLLNQVPQFFDIQSGQPTFQVDTGTANALVITGAPLSYSSYRRGTTFQVLVANTVTGATTLNADGLGTINIQKMTNLGLANLGAGDMQAGGIYALISDGTQLQLLNPT